MSEHTQKLDQVYSARDSMSAYDAYQNWAGEYDSENIGNGYRVPGIGCALFARHVGRYAGPIFDAACGTGIVGGILELLGYTQIVGADLSPAMLKAAKALCAYNHLYEHDLSDPLPERDNTYSAVVCFGSLGPGHAPASCMEEFIRVTQAGGHIVFNTRAETFERQALKSKVEELTLAGRWHLVEQSPVFQSYYLTEPEVTSQVFVFKVA